MIYISAWHASQLQAIYSNLVTSHSQLQSCILLTLRLDNLRFMINKWDCCRLNGDKIMKHTGLALHNTHCCSSAWQPQPRETDRLSEAACCLNFWLQPSATLLVSFIFNDSVNPTRLSLWGLCVCERERGCVFLARHGENKGTETGLNPYSVAECHVCAPGLFLPSPMDQLVQLVLKCCVRSVLRR